MAVNTVIGLVVTLAITVITYFLGGSLKGTKYEKMLKIAGGVIKAAVASTEQIASNKDMSSEDKKKLAIKNATDALQKAGINLPESVINMMVESEVYALNLFRK